MQKMCGRLSDIVNEIRKGAEILTQSSQQVSALSDNLSEGATQQTVNIERLSNCMTQMSEYVSDNAVNTRKANDAFAASYANFCELSESLTPLFENNKEIAKQILKINEIARQTNILSLNASVEAARAGKAGVSFSIVAREVQKLAQVSHDAAEQISQLTAEGDRINNTAIGKIDQSKPVMDSTHSVIEKIVNVSAEQSVSSDTMSDSLGQISGFLHHNAIDAKVLAENASTLDSQAKKLMQTVAFFVSN
jgi:methyl-accepting chemotaxis protein